MRNYTTDFGLAELGIAEIAMSLDLEARRLRALMEKEGGRGIFPSHLVKYVMAWYLSQPRSRRDEIAAEGRRDVDARRAGSPQLWDLEADGPSVAEDGGREAATASPGARTPSICRPSAPVSLVPTRRPGGREKTQPGVPRRLDASHSTSVPMAVSKV